MKHVERMGKMPGAIVGQPGRSPAEEGRPALRLARKGRRKLSGDRSSPAEKHDTTWIKVELDQRGWTYKSFADAIGIDDATASKVLKGERRVPLHRVPALSHYLHLPIAEIMHRTLGDRGHEPSHGLAEAASEQERETYQAAREALEVMVKHELADLSEKEVEDCAAAIALGLARKQTTPCDTDYIESQIISLSERRRLRTPR